jgi:hypothetical protein
MAISSDATQAHALLTLALKNAKGTTCILPPQSSYITGTKRCLLTNDYLDRLIEYRNYRLGA